MLEIYKEEGLETYTCCSDLAKPQSKLLCISFVNFRVAASVIGGMGLLRANAERLSQTVSAQRVHGYWWSGLTVCMGFLQAGRGTFRH